MIVHKLDISSVIDTLLVMIVHELDISSVIDTLLVMIVHELDISSVIDTLFPQLNALGQKSLIIIKYNI